jgi:hypothetical protein
LIETIITNTDSKSIEAGITRLIQYQPNYDSYTVTNSCNFNTIQITKTEIGKLTHLVQSSLDSQYKQLKLILDHNQIIIYPHLGSA